jgi:hypothetical protein
MHSSFTRPKALYAAVALLPGMRDMPDEKRKNGFGMKMDPRCEMTSKRRVSLPEMLVSALIVILVVCITLLCLVPPVSRDALIHHLAVPKLYLKHGGMYEIPFMPFSYYPMNVDLLYLIPLYFGNDIIPKFIHFSFALLTAGLLFGYLKRRTDVIYALFGVVFFLSIPIVVKLSTTAYIDLGIIFFSTASLIYLMRWMENGFKMKFLIISAVFCGLGLGTKYNGLITLFLLTLLVPFLYARTRGNRKLGLLKSIWHGLLFFAISLLVFSPWMARDYHWKRNPIYPLYDNWFNPSKPVSQTDVSTRTEARGGHSIFVYRKVVYHEDWWEMALLPVRLFFEGKDGDPRHFDGKLNPFLLLLPFFAFYRSRQDSEFIRREKRIFFAFALLFFAFAFFSTDLRMRYISPIIPPLVILSVFGIRRIDNWAGSQSIPGRKTFLSCFLLFIAGFPLLYNASYLVSQFKYGDPLSYLTGKLSRDEYIAKHRPEYPAMQYINKNLPLNAKVLFLFIGDRGYYCERDYFFGEPMLGEILKNAASPDEISQRFLRIGATHLLLFRPIFERWRRDNVTEEKDKILEEFFENYVRLLFSKNGFSVLSLAG